jgi:membrane fusion protein YbhG
MKNTFPPLPVRIVIILLVLSAIGYYAFRSLNPTSNGQLSASGTIESVVVNVSPEMAGKVQDVFISEGQTVKAGDPLLSLDDSLLTAQRAVASAQLDAANAGVASAQNALNTAKAQYQITLETALAQDKTTRLKDWFSQTPSQFDQPTWYFTRLEQIQSAQNQVDLNRQALEDAQANLTKISQAIGQANFLEAETRLLNARLAYTIAKTVNERTQNSNTSDTPKGIYNRTHCGTNQGYQLSSAQLTNRVYSCGEDPQLSIAGTDLYNSAQDELTSAQTAYNYLLNTQAANDVLQARADVSVAQEKYYASLDLLRTLQTGDQAVAVTVAQGAMDQAQTAVDQAQKNVQQAQANLDLIDTQMKKLMVYTPMDGVILTRNVEPGEFVQPGAVALTLANLNELTITVYVPEDRYGQITLNQKADVTVDSFPNEVFTGEITNISDQAEFTPRNVQTVEGRSSTVYAVKLKVTDPSGKLKIGMPADVVFK